MKYLPILLLALFACKKKDEEPKPAKVNCANIQTIKGGFATPVIHGAQGRKINGLYYWLLTGTGTNADDNRIEIYTSPYLDGGIGATTSTVDRGNLDTTMRNGFIDFKFNYDVEPAYFKNITLRGFMLFGTRFDLAKGEWRELNAYCNCGQFN